MTIYKRLSVFSWLLLGAVLLSAVPTDRERLKLRGPVKFYTFRTESRRMMHYHFDPAGYLTSIEEEWYGGGGYDSFSIRRNMNITNQIGEVLMVAADGTEIPYLEYYYYPDGKLERLVIYELDSTLYSSDHYDESGRYVMRQWWNGPNTLYGTSLYTYDEQGRASREDYFAELFEHTYYITMHYDEQGHLVRRSRFDSDSGELMDETLLSNDASGRLIQRRYEINDYEVTDSYTYDDWGNVTSIEGYFVQSYYYEYWD